MNWRSCVLVLAVVAATGPVWAAQPKSAAKTPAALPVLMQAVETFDEGPPSKKVSLFAAPEEIEPASFVLKSSKAMSGLTVYVASDLVSGKNKLPASQIAISAVEGAALRPPAPFDLPPGEGRRFWLTVDVPKRTPAGTYQGAVVTAQGKKTVGKLPIELKVLGMRLLKSSKQYGILLPYPIVVDSSYLEMLRTMKANGFGLASVETPPEMLMAPLAAMKEVGLGTPVPFTFPYLSSTDLSDADRQARAAGVKQVLYSVGYEPRTPQQIAAGLKANEEIHKARLKSFAVIDDPAAFDELAGSVDVVDCSVNLPYIQGLLAGARRAPGRHEWWYWDITADAKANRLYGGLLLWKSGLDGAFPPICSPEQAAEVSRLHGGPPGPGTDSVVGTVRWEALREGIDDTRYITTMMSALREVKDALKVRGTKNAALAQKTVEGAEAYLSASLAKPLKDLSNRECQEIRLKLAQYTIKLRAMLK